MQCIISWAWVNCYYASLTIHFLFHYRIHLEGRILWWGGGRRTSDGRMSVSLIGILCWLWTLSICTIFISACFIHKHNPHTHTRTTASFNMYIFIQFIFFPILTYSPVRCSTVTWVDLLYPVHCNCIILVLPSTLLFCSLCPMMLYYYGYLAKSTTLTHSFSRNTQVRLSPSMWTCSWLSHNPPPHTHTLPLEPIGSISPQHAPRTCSLAIYYSFNTQFARTDKPHIHNLVTTSGHLAPVSCTHHCKSSMSIFGNYHVFFHTMSIFALCLLLPCHNAHMYDFNIPPLPSTISHAMGYQPYNMFF